MNHEDNPKSIKYYVKRYIKSNKEYFKGKKVVDFPAGNGITSRILHEVGATPLPFDLFPEYFEIDNLTCKRANINEGIPLERSSVNDIICQEGIEHFSDQFGAFKEFNRILKLKGRMLITTPNYSNLRAKLSYLLSESERFNSIMPPNELDSVWMTNQNITDEVYFGHIFLIGIQKLRALGRLSGFKINKVYFTRAKSTSVLLFPLFYPFILMSNFITYRKNLRKNKNYSIAIKKKVYQEIFNYAISPKILVCGDLMVEFEKEEEFDTINANLKSIHKDFGTT